MPVPPVSAGRDVPVHQKNTSRNYRGSRWHPVERRWRPGHGSQGRSLRRPYGRDQSLQYEGNSPCDNPTPFFEPGTTFVSVASAWTRPTPCTGPSTWPPWTVWSYWMEMNSFEQRFFRLIIASIVASSRSGQGVSGSGYVFFV